MMRLRTLQLCLLMVLGACGSSGHDSETSGAESPGDVGQADADESQEDPWNCGEIGAVCIGHLGIGECVDGECGATLGECYHPPGDCNAICARDGRSCAELACDGATAWVWNSALEEEADLLCAIGHQHTAIALEVGCDEPLDELAMTAMCCCSW